MLVPALTDEVWLITNRMLDPRGPGYALDALWEVAQAMNEAAEMIKVEMLARIANGSHPSNEVARGMGLQHQGG